MPIFSSLFRSRDAPSKNCTARSGYAFFFGGSTSGKAVTERSAIQMMAVYSCVRILAEAVAGLPLNFYRYTEDGGKEKAIDYPLYLIYICTNPAGNIKPDKEKSAEKIDGAVALVMSLDRALRCGNDTSESVYDSRRLLLI